MAYKQKGFTPFTQKEDKPIKRLLRGEFKGVYSDYKDWRKEQDADKNIVELTVPDIPIIGPGKITKGAKLAQRLAKELANKLKKIKKTKFWKESQKIPTVSSSDPGRVTKRLKWDQHTMQFKEK